MPRRSGTLRATLRSILFLFLLALPGLPLIGATGFFIGHNVAAAHRVRSSVLATPLSLPRGRVTVAPHPAPRRSPLATPPVESSRGPFTTRVRVVAATLSAAPVPVHRPLFLWSVPVTTPITTPVPTLRHGRDTRPTGAGTPRASAHGAAWRERPHVPRAAPRWERSGRLVKMLLANLVPRVLVASNCVWLCVPLPCWRGSTEVRQQHLVKRRPRTVSLDEHHAGRAGRTGRREKAALPPVTPYTLPVPPVLARAAYLYEVTDGRTLYAKDAEDGLPMASTTKIMTALLAVKYGRLDDMVTASYAAATIGESSMYLRQGEQLTLRDLLYGLILPSGNDAAIAIAEHVGGSVPAFVAMMNREVALLGMTHTRFVTPHGLDAVGHYASAHDMARLAIAAMRYPL